MVRAGDADGMVSGATCTTANTIRPALQVLLGTAAACPPRAWGTCLPHNSARCTPLHAALLCTPHYSVHAISFQGVCRGGMWMGHDGGPGLQPVLDGSFALSALPAARCPRLAGWQAAK